MTAGFSHQLQRELTRCANGAQISFDPAERFTYGYDNSRRHAMPDAVAWADNQDQVQDIIRFCNRYGQALVARGLASNTVGATVPVNGGVVLSLERMDKILAIESADRYAIVEPGITNAALQDALEEHGFFWPPDPTSARYSTVGGNLACNAAGPRAVKYGTARDNTLGLQAVTGAGEVIKTGVYTTKGVVGYDLTRLLIGSEGTLGVITGATLKLTPKAQAKRSLRALYRDVESAARAVTGIMSQPVVPCALEFMDGRAIALVRNIGGASLPDEAGALLLIEVDGAEATLDQAVESIKQAAGNDGLITLNAARDETQVAQLWAARKALSPALRKAAPDKINEDVVVPVSRIPKLIHGLSRLSNKHKIPIVNFGHAGNGNLHVNLLFDAQDPIQAQAANECLESVFDLVLKLDGTLSGEHGVGIAKRDHIEREVGAETVRLMRRIKQQFDPKGILNPGKLLPEEDSTSRHGVKN